MKIEKTFSFKALGAGKAVSDDQIAKINKFALVQLKPEQVYVRRYLVAHNGIDRDNERFSEDLLKDFTATLPGKGFFVEGHPSSWSGKGQPGEGRFYDASTEEMTPEEFKNITHEEITLPEGITKAKVLWGDAYLLKLDSNADTLAKIDAGIYSFVSIGFKAPLVDVTDKNGNVIYGEYKSKGQAMEGSLVWLGAQQGASAMKNAGKGGGTPPLQDNLILEGRKMKEFLKRLSEKIGKAFSEEQAVDEIASLITEKDAKIREMEPHAADGKAYRKHLVDDLLKYGALIEEVPTDAESQKKEMEFVSGWPIDRIKSLRDKYKARARSKFPDKFTFKGKDEADRQAKDGDGKKHQQATGRKDYTTPQHNELFETVGK